ncbi:MAG: hypothetical protein ACE366_17330 [Bradymonadia bacterium]
MKSERAAYGMEGLVYTLGERRGEPNGQIAPLGAQVIPISMRDEEELPVWPYLFGDVYIIR